MQKYELKIEKLNELFLNKEDIKDIDVRELLEILSNNKHELASKFSAVTFIKVYKEICLLHSDVIADMIKGEHLKETMLNAKQIDIDEEEIY